LSLARSITFLGLSVRLRSVYRFLNASTSGGKLFPNNSTVKFFVPRLSSTGSVTQPPISSAQSFLRSKGIGDTIVQWIGSRACLNSNWYRAGACWPTTGEVVMNEIIPEFEFGQAEMLTPEVTDAALETAAEAGSAGVFTLGACTGLSVCPA
jgi:hypothetical protein